MNRKFLLSIFFVFACAALTSAILQWRAQSREAGLRALLERQAAALAAQREERARLTEAFSRRAAYDTEKSTLLKLRAEVTELRHSATNLNDLRAALNHLQNEVQTRPPSATNARALHPSKILASWTKDQITFAGYADETSALQSTLWAMSRHEPSALLSAFAPGAVSKLWRDSKPNPTPADIDGTSPEAIKARESNWQRLAASLRPVTAFHLVSDNITPRLSEMDPTCQIYKVYFEGDGATRGLGFKKVGNELKFVGVYAIGGTDEHPTYESNLWP
jgi:hypothetical protein